MAQWPSKAGLDVGRSPRNPNYAMHSKQFAVSFQNTRQSSENPPVVQSTTRTDMDSGRSQGNPYFFAQTPAEIKESCPSPDNFAVKQWPGRTGVETERSKRDVNYLVPSKQNPAHVMKTVPPRIPPYPDPSTPEQCAQRRVIAASRSRGHDSYPVLPIQQSMFHSSVPSDNSDRKQWSESTILDTGTKGNSDYPIHPKQHLIPSRDIPSLSEIPLPPGDFIKNNTSFQPCTVKEEEIVNGNASFQFCRKKKETKRQVLSPRNVVNGKMSYHSSSEHPKQRYVRPLPPGVLIGNNPSFQFCGGEIRNQSTYSANVNTNCSDVTIVRNKSEEKIPSNHPTPNLTSPRSHHGHNESTSMQSSELHSFSRLVHEPQKSCTNADKGAYLGMKTSQSVSSSSGSIQRSQLLNSTNSFLPVGVEKQSQKFPQLVGYSSSDDESPDKISSDQDAKEEKCYSNNSSSLQLKNSAEKRKFSEITAENEKANSFAYPSENDVGKNGSFRTPTSHRMYTWHSSLTKKQLFRSSSDSSLLHLPKAVKIDTGYDEMSSEQSDDKMEVKVKKHEKENIRPRTKILQSNAKPEETAVSFSGMNDDKLTKEGETDSFEANFSFASQESIEKPIFFNPSIPPPPSPYFNPETFWRCYNQNSSPLSSYSPSFLGGGVLSANAQPYYDNYLGGYATCTPKPSQSLHTHISPLMSSIGIANRSGYSLPTKLVTKPSVSPKLSETRSESSTPVSNWKARMKERGNNHGVNFIDSHCHIDFIYRNQEFQGTFTKYMRLNSDTFPYTFEGCVSVFCRPESFTPQGGLWHDLAEEANIWLAFGCHPKNATSYTQRTEDGLKKCLQHKKVVALGEIGLDYSGTFYQHSEVQKVVFRRQLNIALEKNLPLVIHCRDAEVDCLNILEKVVPKDHKIHCHCFTGSFDSAQKWLNLFPNLFIGLTPLVTKKSAWPTKNVAFHIPLDRLLLETDSPYFLPSEIPRGEMKCSHPGFAFVVAEEVAYLKDLPVAQVLKACRENTRNMYGI